MNERKAKSAPAQSERRKPKDKKVTTIKEIHAWVHKGNNDQGNRRTARNTGLLTENVTEERMLFAKQLELGRERYKFLANHAYEKQKFIERQRRKEKRMQSSIVAPGKDLTRKRSLTVRIPQVDELSQTSADSNEHIPKIDLKKMPSAGDIEHTKVSVEEMYLPKAVEEVHLPKTVTVTPRRPKSITKGIYLDSSKTANTKSLNLVCNSTEKFPSVISGRNEINSVPQTPKSVTSGPQTSPAIATTVDVRCLATNVSFADQLSLSWVKRRRNNRRIRYGEKFPSSVDDPRYVALSESLIPLEVDTQRLDDVSDIIKKHEILRRDSKTFKSVKSKVNHQKFLAFLLEKGLTIA